MSLIKLSKEETLTELRLGKLDEVQKEQAWQLVTSIISTRVLDEILKLLAEEDKKILLGKLTQSENEATEFLNSKLDNLDQILASVVDNVKKDLKEEIENVGS